VQRLDESGPSHETKRSPPILPLRGAAAIKPERGDGGARIR
jgi:hypothetical protein